MSRLVNEIQYRSQVGKLKIQYFYTIKLLTTNFHLLFDNRFLYSNFNTR